MLKQEFLSLCQSHNPEAFKNGLDDKEYRKYENLYEELTDLDKQDFCLLLMTDIPQLLTEAAKEISYWCGQAEDLTEDKRKLTEALALRGGYDTIREVYDMKTVINMKLDNGDPLSEEERQYIKRNLN